MYRYVVIDDESIIRKGTIKKLETLQEIVVCCGEASNGKEGTALIKECNPDFVILDMYMPVMDGMELLPYLSEHYPELPLIVISGYQDFKYMKQAISSKAIDYILKPFSSEEIQQTVLSTIKILKSKEKIKTQISSAEDDREKAYYNLDIKYLKNQILGYESDWQSICSESLKFINNTHHLILFTLYLTNLSTKLGLEEWLKENGYSEFMVYLTHPSIPQFRFLILFFPEDSTFKMRVCEEFLKLIFLWGSQQKCMIQIGVSETHRNVSELHKAYQETTEALDQQSVNCSCCEYHFCRTMSAPVSINWPSLEEFLFRIESGESEKVRLMIEELFQYYKTLPICTLADVKRHCEHISSECRSILNYYLHKQEKISKPSHNMQAIVNTLFSLEDLQEYYQQFFLNITAMLKSESVYLNGELIDNIKTYVNHNFQKDLTRDFVASLFYINSSYLSQIFKKKTGCKFIDYVNDVRIERAKQLLSGTDRKMYQISKTVGYENTKYFFRVFKKKTGMTPEKYRENHIR